MPTDLPEPFKSLNQPVSGGRGSAANEAARLRTASERLARARTRMETAVLAAFERQERNIATRDRILAGVQARRKQNRRTAR